MDEVVRSGVPFEEEVTAIQRLLGSSFAESATLRKTVERLQAKVDTRELVQQAQGIIMGRLDISADAALEVLSSGAGLDDQELRLIATAVVAERRTPAEIAAVVLPAASEDSPQPPLSF
jgi:AmiR/NasT family two-component response regulator